jgi:hypothetical protein
VWLREGLVQVTDDELTDLVITAATSRYRYGEEELGYVVAGTITGTVISTV